MTTVHFNVVPFRGQQLPADLRDYIGEANQTLGWTSAQSQGDIDYEYAEYYVLFEERDVRGYVGLHHVIDEATINLVYIAPSHRQKGLATELLTFVLTQLTHRQVKHIFLEVRAQNIAAQKLYEKLNFQTLTIRKNYYKHPVDDALIMQLALPQERSE